MEVSTLVIPVHLASFQPDRVSAEQLKDNYFNCQRCLSDALVSVRQARMYTITGSDLDTLLCDIEQQLRRIEFED
jgi:hypothetical protein